MGRELEIKEIIINTEENWFTKAIEEMEKRESENEDD